MFTFDYDHRGFDIEINIDGFKFEILPGVIHTK